MSIEVSENAINIGGVSFWALGDRIIIQEDAFKTGYECSGCGGSGSTPCPNCLGAGERNGKKCSHCKDGQVECEACGGKGGLLVAPDTAQRRPTSGTIVSAGPKVVGLKVGDSVLYSNFAGYVVDLDGVALRILHESEILAGMEGHLTLNRLKHKSDIAAFGV